MQTNRKVYLFSIGINRYNNYSTLSFCGNDATEMTKTIEDVFGNLETKILLIDDSVKNNPSGDQIRSILDRVKKINSGKDDLVIFYFAGHGFSCKGKDYIVCTDTNPDDMNTAISTDDVVSSLRMSGNGTSVLIIDACRNETDRSTSSFSERTSELARREGIIAFFSCSPGEVSQELSSIGSGHGIFTFSFISGLKALNQATPYSIDKHVYSEVQRITKDHNIRVQKPYTIVAPIQKTMLDLISGQITKLIHNGDRRMILIAGSSNSGKTSIGQYIARELGYSHAEMSSFAWKRFNKFEGYEGSIQDFMEDVIWKDGDEDLIAKDLIEECIDIDKLVVCGPRKPEEVQTLINAGWAVTQIYVFANSMVRFQRHSIAMEASRYALGYRDFVKKDLRELGWGLANIASMNGFNVVINEKDFANMYQGIDKIINNNLA